MRPLVIALIICTSTIPTYAQYSGGSGTAEDPYRIATAADLIALGEEPNDYDKHFILTADIDLDPNLPGRKVFDRAVIAPDVDDSGSLWQFEGIPFTGIFDGNDHTISHLMIRGVSYLGLFGQTGSGARVCNLALEAVDIVGTGGDVGGLVGCNGGSIISSYSTGIVSGNDRVGGLVGSSCGGSITKCYVTGAVNGNDQVGGLVGELGAEECGGSVFSCYSTATVAGSSSVGGLIGGAGWYVHIATSYSTGAVNGNEFVGGLVGVLEWTEYNIITSCYSVGAVNGNEDVGGLVGAGELRIRRCFYDMETSGQSTSGGGIGLTTVEMMDPYVLGLYGLLVNDPNWVLDAGRDYPRLAWEGTPGQIIPEPVIDWLDGEGTEQEPYRIDTAEQLILLGRARVLWDKHFVLDADIDLDPNLPGGKVFDRAVIESMPDWGGTAFMGVFDGNGHTISNLTITGDSFMGMGLFGYLGSGATISNLALEAVDVYGTGAWWGGVGSLAGDNNGSIANCYSTGSVIGDRWVGGLVGSNYRGSISDCYSIGTVNGTSEIGGLVGRNFVGSISDCYSTGSVNGTSEIGGLVGRNDGGSISDCYSIGTPTGNDYIGGLVGYSQPWHGHRETAYPEIVDSYWDIEISNEPNMCGFQEEDATGCDNSYGKTTAEMKQQSTFGDWDFINVWDIGENQTYPFLRTHSAGDVNKDGMVNFLDMCVVADQWMEMR